MRRSGRERKKPQRYSQTSSYFSYVNVVSADSPQTYEEALSGDDGVSWKEAMDRFMERSKGWREAKDGEMNSLMKNKIWQLVEKPKGKRIVDLKWICTKKSDNGKEARLVVRGFQEKDSRPEMDMYKEI